MSLDRARRVTGDELRESGLGQIVQEFLGPKGLGLLVCMRWGAIGHLRAEDCFQKDPSHCCV